MSDLQGLSISLKGLFVQKDLGLRTREVRQRWGVFILIVITFPCNGIYSLAQRNISVVPGVTTVCVNALEVTFAYLVQWGLPGT